MEPVLDGKDANIGENLKLNAHLVHESGLEPQEVTEFYDKWSQKYDSHCADFYCGHKDITQALRRHVGDNYEASILDIGCGTGLVAEEVAKNGYTNIEGLDPSKGMTDKARAKNLYEKIYDEYLTDHVPCLDSDNYDVVIACGVLSTGHGIQRNAMREIFRCLKPGGFAFFLTSSTALVDGQVRQEIDQLVEEGGWKIVECSQASITLQNKAKLVVLVKSDAK